jgi:hypothetical protein
MNVGHSVRVAVAVAVALLLSQAALVSAQSHTVVPSAPSHPPSSHPAPATGRASRPAAVRGGGGDHLAEWMNRHSNLTPTQQVKALESEPGFSQLPATTQQRMRDTLTKLQTMPPEKREQILARNEAMERLNPVQREQVRGAMKQLAALSPDDRRYVARTFRGLRELPPQQRQAVLASDRFAHLNDAERATLNSLMQVEPLLLPAYDSAAATPPATPAP